jgi:hypothetical protein
MRKYQLFTLFVVVLTAIPSFGANYYVRKGATGTNNGSNWTNAWNDMSQINWSSVSCGDTVWLAGGTYTTALNIGVTKNCTASAVINVNRVLGTDSVPVAAAGWSSSYDSQVILPNISVVGPAAYITINGRKWQGSVVGSGGIKVLIPGSSGDGIDASNNGDGGPAIDHITWSYVEVYGPSCVTSGSCTGGGVVGVNVAPYCSTANRTNLLFDHMNVHQTGEAFRGCGWGNSTIQYSLIYDTNNDGQQHEDLLYTNPPYENVTWRYNQIFMSPNDGIFFEGTGGDANFEFYGNVVYHSGGELMVFKSETSGTYGPVYIYNNVFENDGTFGDYQPGWLDFTGPMASGSTVQNNVFENVSAVSTVPNGDYNAWSTSAGKSDSGSHSFTYNPGALGASTMFISESSGNPIAANFHLTAAGAAAFAKGVTLTAPYNQDADGNTRGTGGVWYIGAYQYQSAAPAPPTSLTGVVH